MSSHYPDQRSDEVKYLASRPAQRNMDCAGIGLDGPQHKRSPSVFAAALLGLRAPEEPRSSLSQAEPGQRLEQLVRTKRLGQPWQVGGDPLDIRIA